MFLVELGTGKIPEVYANFAAVIGDVHWRRRTAQIRQEIKGNRFLADYLVQENAIAFQLEHLREVSSRLGAIPPAEFNNSSIYPAASFAAQVLNILELSPPKLAEQFKGRIQGAFRNPPDMRAMRLELSAATHFARRGGKISWPEMNGQGTFDLFVENVGPNGLEVECKSISEDKGRQISKREVLDFYMLLSPYLRPLKTTLQTGLAVVLTVPKRLPTKFKDRGDLAKHVGRQINQRISADLLDGTNIRISEFDTSSLGDIPSSRTPSEMRAAVDAVTSTVNRQVMVIGYKSGGALALAIQSAEDDTLMKSVFATLSDSEKKQFSKHRAGMFFVGLSGLDGAQLLSVAGQDQDPNQPPTSLRLAVSRFLASANRDHVVGVGFLSESALRPLDDGTVDSGGAAYYFPKRESPFWSEDFSRLFSWNT